MPTPLVASTVTFSHDGRKVQESAHTSFEAAWDQVSRELRKLRSEARENATGNLDDRYEDAFDRALGDAQGALTEAPGQVNLYVGPSEIPAYTFMVVAYEGFEAGKAA